MCWGSEGAGTAVLSMFRRPALSVITRDVALVKAGERVFWDAILCDISGDCVYMYCNHWLDTIC
jgi:hypothetical protein